MFHFFVGCNGLYTGNDGLVNLFEDSDRISIWSEGKNFFICLDEEIFDDQFGMVCYVKAEIGTDNFADAAVEPVKNLQVFMIGEEILNNVIGKVGKCISIVDQISKLGRAFRDEEVFYCFGDLLERIYTPRYQLIQFVIIPIDIH